MNDATEELVGTGSRIRSIPDLPDTLNESDEEPDPILESVIDSSDLRHLMDLPELRKVITGAMSGELHLDKPLEVNQPRKLSVRAIQAIILCVGNYYTLREVSEISGINYVYLTKLVRHPYARRILTIANAAAVSELNSVSRRLKRRSPKMLGVIERIATDDKVMPATRLRAAFGWLEYAGHAPAQKVEEKREETHRFIVEEKRSLLIAQAIQEARAPVEALAPAAEIIDVDYSQPELESVDASKVA